MMSVFFLFSCMSDRLLAIVLVHLTGREVVHVDVFEFVPLEFDFDPGD